MHLRGPRNAYFRLWTEDAASAAQLVASLPTRRTIEFESEFSEPQVASSWHMPIGWLIALLAAAAVAALIWSARHRAEVRRDAPPPPPPASAAPTRRAVSPEDALLAQADLTRFGPRIVALEAEFTLAFSALMDGRVSQEKFADELEQWLLPQWDDLEAQLRRANPAAGSLQQRADADLMAAINNWQLATRAYTDDLRNQRFVQKPFAYMGRAYTHRWRAERLQIALERGPPYDLEPAR